MKTIESDVIVGHILEFLAQVLAPIMRYGKIAPIDAVFTGEPRNAPKGTWVLEGGIKISCIYQISGLNISTRHCQHLAKKIKLCPMKAAPQYTHLSGMKLKKIF